VLGSARHGTTAWQFCFAKSLPASPDWAAFITSLLSMVRYVKIEWMRELLEPPRSSTTNGRRAQQRITLPGSTEPLGLALQIFINHRLLLRGTNDERQVWLSGTLLTEWRPLAGRPEGCGSACDAFEPEAGAIPSVVPQ
jgi:hypothetical protein